MMKSESSHAAALAVAQPASLDELVETVRRAAAAGTRLYPGQPPATAAGSGGGLQLCLRQLNAVVDYPARDLTITVQAGMTFGELDRLLQAENQQLPVDVADSQQTLGAIVAGDVAGPRRYGYGTLRDYVIGIEAVDGIGRVFHAGGRVVKNVAGYDLCRLLTGSRGCFGILTQLTFKLKPRVPDSQLVVYGFRTLQQLEAALERLNRSAATPVILDVLNRSAAEWLLPQLVPAEQLTTSSADRTAFADSVGFVILAVEGTAAACAWQVSTLQDELEKFRHWWLPSGRISTAAWCQAMMQAQTSVSDRTWLARLTTLPSRIVATMNMLSTRDCVIFGHAGNGILYVGPGGTTAGAAGGAPLQPAVEADCLQVLSGVVADGCGSCGLLKSETQRQLPLPVQTQELLTALRNTFDPQHIFGAAF